MTENPGLPETITRPCCRGKSCGDTKLTLTKFEFPDPADAYPDLYAYCRANGDSYSGEWMSEDNLRNWIEDTK